MVFRSVTYNAKEVDFVAEEWMRLKDYSEQPSGSWDVTDVPLKVLYRTEYRRHGEVPVVSVQLDIEVARKSQFYVITFLLPCVCIALLTLFVFYLPTQSGEKLCAAISILFSIVVFLLILIDILPPSDTLPLMTKFLVFTFVFNLISALLTTITVNWSFRTMKTNVMTNWIRYVFLGLIPKFLRIQRPKKKRKKKLFGPRMTTPETSTIKSKDTIDSHHSARFALAASTDHLVTRDDPTKRPRRFPSYATIAAHSSGFSISRESNHSAVIKELHNLGEYLDQFPGYVNALENVAFIAKNLEDQDEEGDVSTTSCLHDDVVSRRFGDIVCIHLSQDGTKVTTS